MQYLFLSCPVTYALVWFMFHIHCKEVDIGLVHVSHTEVDALYTVHSFCGRESAHGLQGNGMAALWIIVVNFDRLDCL